MVSLHACSFYCVHSDDVVMKMDVGLSSDELAMCMNRDAAMTSRLITSQVAQSNIKHSEKIVSFITYKTS